MVLGKDEDAIVAVALGSESASPAASEVVVLLLRAMPLAIGQAEQHRRQMHLMPLQPSQTSHNALVLAAELQRRLSAHWGSALHVGLHLESLLWLVKLLVNQHMTAQVDDVAARRVASSPVVTALDLVAPSHVVRTGHGWGPGQSDWPTVQHHMF
mmetsp:Transcript_33667/g.78686  ORF Transcript_33667/g.78686 Transcript_33667/m.78686 type:complete len:155 (+) Transcript_33667:431-895(+)